MSLNFLRGARLVLHGANQGDSALNKVAMTSDVAKLTSTLPIECTLILCLRWSKILSLMPRIRRSSSMLSRAHLCCDIHLHQEYLDSMNLALLHLRWLIGHCAIDDPVIVSIDPVNKVSMMSSQCFPYRLQWFQIRLRLRDRRDGRNSCGGWRFAQLLPCVPRPGQWSRRSI